MRVALFVVACACLAGSALADFSEGEPGETDIVVANKIIFKPPIPWKPMAARLSATAPPGSNITAVNVLDLGPAKSDALLLKGGVGQSSVLVLVTGKRGEGLLVEFKVHASAPVTTTEEPTTTTSAAPPTNTVEPTTSSAAPPTTTVVPTTSSAAPPTNTVVPTTRETGKPTYPTTTEVPATFKQFIKK